MLLKSAHAHLSTTLQKQSITAESYSGVEALKGDSLHRGRGEKILTLPQSHG